MNQAMKQILVPDLGDFKDVLVIDVLAKAGDHVEVESPLLTLETDKATMDIPSPFAGVIATMHVTKGDKVSTGSLLATLEEASAEASTTDGPETAAPADASKTAAAEETPAASNATQADAAAEGASTAQAAATAEPATTQAATIPAESSPPHPATTPSGPVASKPAAEPASPVVDEAAFALAHAGPSVRALARELGVDLGRVSGSGRKGRITNEDVKAFVKAALAGGATAPAVSSGAGAGTGLPRVPTVDFAKFGPVEVLPLTRIQRISGPRLHASWVNVPHVTQFEEADVTELEEARKWLKLRAAGEGIGLTSLAFVIRACVLGLQRYPRLGASLDEGGNNLVLKKYCHIGFAADTPDGLVVPVIRDADRKDVFELARALGDLSAKARTGKLSAADMQGGCFTISNLGGIGGTSFTPIINAPEVAVLGISRAALKPVWREGAFVPRLMLPLSLSYDHRVVDGADGARFVGFLATALADVAGLMAALP
jgi:pyruvate dehydrogenase E2 component (dihydrolipoamide acetyltransferase)